jgi:hypothetical protein
LTFQTLSFAIYSGRPPLWSIGQSSWLQIQKSWCLSRRYQIFWDVVDLQRGPLSLVSTIEKLLERKISGSGLGNWDYDHADHATPLHLQKLALTSPTSGGRLVDKFRSQTKATELYIRNDQFNSIVYTYMVLNSKMVVKWFLLILCCCPNICLQGLRQHSGNL